MSVFCEKEPSQQPESSYSDLNEVILLLLLLEWCFLLNLRQLFVVGGGLWFFLGEILC